MKTHLNNLLSILAISFVFLGLVSCNPNAIVSTADPTASVATARPATESPTEFLALTPSPIPVENTPQPKPSPTALALRTIPIEGGDPGNKFYAELVFPNEQVFISQLWFRVYAHKPVESKVDGEGIESVDFTIRNSKGVVVHIRKEKQAGYCAFGGGEPDCVIWDFAEHQYIWPDGDKIVSGTYTLNVLATSNDQVFMFSETQFTIQVP